MNSSDIMYFDNASTTKVDDEVIDSMLPFFKDYYGNASSSHKYGSNIKKEIEISKQKVADLINSKTKEIIFTSGATESINMVLKGITKTNSKRNQIITVSTEHSAVLDTCLFLENQGIDIVYLPVKSSGIIDLEELNKIIGLQTLMICIMLVNNETGVIQPIKEITDLAHKHGALMFTDATQAIGKIKVDVLSLDVDFMAFSAHKFHGPKGIGALFLKEQLIKNFNSLIHGGGHQDGLRSGTLNVTGIIGLAKACEIAKVQVETSKQIEELRNELENELLKIDGTYINGDIEKRICNISNICFPSIDSDVLINRLDTICVSNGSACTSALIEPSYVLKAMGLSNEDAFSSLRFSLSKYTTKKEVTFLIEKLKQIITYLTSLKHV
ncbi:cysteine desulfurase family protein [Flavobacterium frigoris]|uniref:cysteine desulfurase n=1 Tax=Flavobacterium frigoris TaxID=229204 RepID=A0A1H9MV73_FLAFI|nr:cysteine desulfurase family protein [Flavobacterium frigoris]SER27606.1 cysteine desulfurase IscS [Flavobacterium frigoris]